MRVAMRPSPPLAPPWLSPGLPWLSPGLPLGFLGGSAAKLARRPRPHPRSPQREARRPGSSMHYPSRIAEIDTRRCTILQVTPGGTAEGARRDPPTGVRAERAAAGGAMLRALRRPRGEAMARAADAPRPRAHV